MKKTPQIFTLTLDKIVGGGQTLGTLSDGKKAFVWGGLPGEQVTIRTSKIKSHLVEGIVTDVITASPDRIEPRDPGSFISTSPWQIMAESAEDRYKAALIEEAFELHDIVLPNPITVFSNNVTYGYRNKMEYSWFSDATPTGDTLDLAFFARGGRAKCPIDQSSLARPEISALSHAVRDLLRTKDVSARNLKTLLIRCNQKGEAVWQLYVKDKLPDLIQASEAAALPAIGGEIIFSNPKSPASVITERLATFGTTVLEDTIRNVPFRYAVEGFFQVNIPVYEHALADMQQWIEQKPVVDLYSGVGSIGLTIGGEGTTLVEINEHAVREMRENIKRLDSNATAVLAPSEQALEYITSDVTVIVDPPRAGLHSDVIVRLLEVKPARIIYLSCNPVTQARDIALLAEAYGIRHHQGYNFFPRTPHIEHLVILDVISRA